MKSIILLGRTNVGKSTFFNKICQKNLSIINKLSGTTRDYISSLVTLFNINFKIIDTPGLNLDKRGETFKKNIAKSDIIFFIINGKEELKKEDFLISQIILSTNKKFLLLVNKTETNTVLSKKSINKLRLGEGIFISTKHQIGIYKVYSKLKNVMNNKNKVVHKNKECLSIAIIGKSNIGKSTFFNSILGFNRNFISTMPSTTRDFITAKIDFKGVLISLLDTAGIKNSINNSLEKFSIKKSIQILSKSNIILMMMSSVNIFNKQELTLINLILKKNKLLILIINKKDLIRNIKTFREKIKFIINKKIEYIKDILIFFTCAKQDIKTNYILKKIIFLWKKYNLRVSKIELRILLKEINIKENNKVKIINIEQAKNSPLKFLFLINKVKQEMHNKLEMLYSNMIKKVFKLHHLYVRVVFKIK